MKSTKKHSVIRVMVAAILLGIAVQGYAAPKKFKMNFKDADIKDIVKVISDITGRSFIIDQKVRGKITIIAPREVTGEEAYRIFLSILEANDLTLVKVGNIYKIIPAREAKNYSTRIGTGAWLPPDIDEFETRLVPLKYINAQSIANIVRALISKFGNIQTYEPTNTLIITDLRSNLKKILQIISKLDTETYGEVVEIIPVQYADVEKIASVLKEIFGTQKGRSAAPGRGVKGKGRMPEKAQGAISKIIPYVPINSLIVVGSPEGIEAMKEIIKRLDVSVPEGEGTIRVYYLQYADAESIASTLNSVLTGVKKTKGKVGGKQAGPQVKLKESNFAITADKATNSLIIFAAPQTMKEIIALIQKLDIPRKQVYVEAAIVEVSLNKLREWGLQYHGGKAFGETAGAVFGWAPGGAKTIVLDPQQLLALSGLFAAGFGKTIEVTVGGATLSVPAFGLFLRLLESENDVNVLSTPHILTMDNEEATITVAQNVPFPTGKSVGAGGVTTQTIQRQDVGITLKITPRINEANSVNLKIFTEVSNVSQGPQGLDVNVLGVTTFKRTSQTVVQVADSHTVVIGGLMRDAVTKTEQKVPILGDIPIIGWFFRSTQKRVEKTNLLIFLTPHIIRSEEDLIRLSQEKIEEGFKFRQLYTGTGEEFRRRFSLESKEKGKEEISPEDRTSLEEKLSPKHRQGAPESVTTTPAPVTAPSMPAAVTKP